MTRKGKWKKPSIAPQREHDCVPHAFSLMRLALRYKSGLPDGYKPKNKPLSWAETGRLAFDCFPKHHVVWTQSNCTGLTCGLLGDGYIFAWSYMQDGDESGHVVIGFPSRTDEMIVNWVLAVSIERKWQ